MKLIAVMMVVAGLILGATPVTAAPRWVNDFCWQAAQRVSPRLTEAQKEALYRQLHSRLDGWIAAATTRQEEPNLNRY